MIVIDRPEVIMEPGLGQQFGQCRRLLAAAKTSMAMSAACMILAGVELNRLHKLHGTRRGGDRRSVDQTRNVAGLKWEDLVQQEIGVSHDTARRYMAMADEARKRVPELDSEWLLGTPLANMPDLQREELLARVQKCTDGNTAQQLMWDWGIAKKPRGGKGGRQLALGDKLSPEEAAQANAQQIAMPLLQGLFLLRSQERDSVGHLPLATDDPAKVASLIHLEAELAEVTALIKSALATARKGRK